MNSQDTFKRGVEAIAQQYGANVSRTNAADLKSTIGFVRRVMEMSKQEFLADYEDALRVLAAAETGTQQKGHQT